MASFLDTFASKVNDLGNKVAAKTSNSTENFRLSNEVKNEERQIASDYQEIGKTYRQLYGDNPDPAFADLLRDITQREAIVAEHQKKIQTNKGRVNCPSCGAEIDARAVFCTACGAKNPVAEELERAQAAAQAEKAAQEAARAQAQAAAQAQAEAASAAASAAATAATNATAAMKTCKACGASIGADNLFCTNCGTRQD
jgi:uncharacterized OB-fold protein